MSLNISGLCTSSIATNLQSTLTRRGGADVGSFMRTAAEWIERGLEYTKAHVSIADVGFAVAIIAVVELSRRQGYFDIRSSNQVGTDAIVDWTIPEPILPDTAPTSTGWTIVNPHLDEDSEDNESRVRSKGDSSDICGSCGSRWD